jgi:hypothetical protein
MKDQGIVCRKESAATCNKNSSSSGLETLLFSEAFTK